MGIGPAYRLVVEGPTRLELSLADLQATPLMLPISCVEGWRASATRTADPRRWTTLVVVAALGHDLVLAPLILLCALLCRRVLPTHGRGLVQGAGLVSLVLVLLALPGIGRYGARADNSSVLPRNDGQGLVIAIVTVAFVTAVLLVVRLLTRRPAGGHR